MSLKGVELQIALPKTFEAGKQVEKAQQFVHGNQEMAQQATEKQLQKNRTTVIESNALDYLDDEHPHKDREQQQHHKNEKQKSKEQRTKHPFKGNFFDFSG